uniref:GAE domain-containing protein n=1 Tax=Anopheles maculatus TaxID=74869 RepID=A0A182STJ4_9DIPT
MNIDLQQRANEFSQLFTNYKHLRNSLLEKMPKLKLTELTTSEYNADFASPESTEAEEQSEEPEAVQEQSNQDILLDLLGDCFSSDGNGNNALAVVPVSQPAAATTQPYYPQTASFNQAGLSSYNNNVPMAGTTDSIMDLLGLAAAAASAPTQTHQTIPYTLPGTAASIPSIDVYNKDDIYIRFFIHPTVDEQLPSSTASARITVQTTNGSQATIEKFLFQAAVPKSFVLTLREPSSTVMPPGGTIMQDLLIARQAPPNQGGTGLRMKVRFSYEVENYSMMEQIDVNDFPSGFLR